MLDDPMYIPTYQDMLDAHERIKPHIRRTPVRTSAYLNDLTGAQLFFKCENFQEPGAFKVRGATNAVFGLDEAQAKNGVATHSSGNHASCLSYAAMLRGIPCNVVMPTTAPQAKKDTVRRYGGVITECEPSTTSREETFAQIQAQSGGDFVHPYNADDAPKTIADGLLVPLKERTWHFVSNHVTDILTASEDEIIAAMKLAWKHLRIVMEASSAVPLATILKNKDPVWTRRIFKRLAWSWIWTRWNAT